MWFLSTSNFPHPRKTMIPISTSLTLSNTNSSHEKLNILIRKELNSDYTEHFFISAQCGQIILVTMQTILFKYQ